MKVFWVANIVKTTSRTISVYWPYSVFHFYGGRESGRFFHFCYFGGKDNKKPRPFLSGAFRGLTQQCRTTWKYKDNTISVHFNEC
jgi:hypothetical protein